MKYEAAVTRIEHSLNQCFENGEATTRVADILVCTTESLNYMVRDIIKARGAILHDDPIKKLVYLRLRSASHDLKVIIE